MTPKDKPTYRILVADDHIDHLEMISRAIRRSSHRDEVELIRAEDGESAYQVIQKGVDMAFLDIKMPGRSGLQILEQLRADPATRDLPVVIVSSSSDPWDTQASRDHGALAHIEKGRFSRFRQEVAAALDEGLALAARRSGAPEGGG